MTMPCYHNPLRVRRVLSKRGWCLLLVRYDWQDTGIKPPADQLKGR